MPVYNVYIEHKTLALDRPFSYSSPHHIEPGCRVIVPFGRQKLTGLVTEVLDKAPDHVALKDILEVLDDSPVLNAELMELAKKMAYDCVSPLMQVVGCMLPASARPQSHHLKPIMEEWLEKQPVNEKLTVKQQQLYDSLPQSIVAAAARKQFSASILKTLQKKGALLSVHRPKRAGVLPVHPNQPWPQLNEDQKKACRVIEENPHRPVLLSGVTGSGKTEVFFHRIRRALEEKKQVLFMVPEISLTPMMIERVAGRFDVPVFVCHSRLSRSELEGLWNFVQNGEPCIVIGTRKAVFLPFSKLGCIILDEEHDSSYKQDSAPRYHARDAALFRAAWHKASLILASATPSLESYARAWKDRYALARLDRRAAGSFNRIHLVDLKKERTISSLSQTLLNALNDRLKKKEKSLILLNRRGYYPTVICPDCREYLVCDECQLPLSWHKQENALVCHTCGKRFAWSSECPNCHGHDMKMSGQGTERLEENIEELFSSAVIIRMDRDTTTQKQSHQQLLDRFEKEGDILMGTQMIAKGLDYSDITLAAILSIDSVLARPNYLASEQAYQLAEQTAGRAGRAGTGDVYIQTYNPDHYVMKYILSHDYEAFFKEEMHYRHAQWNPPYTFLSSVVFSGQDASAAWNMASKAAAWTMEQIYLNGEGGLKDPVCRILGPVQISSRKKQARFRLIFKDKNKERMKSALWKMRGFVADNKYQGSVEFNVNPMMLEE